MCTYWRAVKGHEDLWALKVQRAGWKEIRGQIWNIIFIIMFLFLFNHLTWRIAVFLLPTSLLYLQSEWEFLMESTIIHRYVSTVAQKGHSKHWLQRGPFVFLNSSWRRWWDEGYSVGCHLQLHCQIPLMSTGAHMCWLDLTWFDAVSQPRAAGICISITTVLPGWSTWLKYAYSIIGDYLLNNTWLLNRGEMTKISSKNTC